MAWRSTWRVLSAALIISLGGGFHYGYQLTVMNPSEESFTNFINRSHFIHYSVYLEDATWTYFWPTIVNMQMAGGLIGTFFAKPILEKLGRKRGFYITNCTVLIACLLQGVSKLANSWELLLSGRFVLGVAQGVQMGIQPVYFNEISTKSIRGLIGSMTGFIIEFGFFLAAVVALPVLLGDETKWPFLFLLESVPSVVALFALPFLPESPKYLASKGENENAIRSLRFYGRSESEIEEEMKDIRLELKEEFSSMSLRDLYSKPYIRKGVSLGLMVMFSGIFSGIMAFSYFSTSVLQGGGLTQRAAQFAAIGLTGPSCLGALLGGLVMDRFGRRPIILVTNTLLLAMNIFFIIFAYLGRNYSMSWASYANIAVVASFTLCFGLGPGVMMWLLTAELVPIQARATAHSLAMMASWIFGAVATLVFYPLQRAVHEFSFLLHTIPLAISIVYLWFYLPETKNKSIIQIMHQLGGTSKEREYDEACGEVETRGERSPMKKLSIGQ